jgi:hypothetical protein
MRGMSGLRARRIVAAVSYDSAFSSIDSRRHISDLTAEGRSKQSSMRAMNDIYRDCEALLATEMRLLAENERYLVLAVRIEKAAIARNAPAVGALLETAMARGPETQNAPPRTGQGVRTG